MKTLLSKKNYIITAVAIVCVLGIVAIFFMGGNKEFKEHISLGNKYLQEMKYEESIVEFTAAFNLEPKNKEAAEGIENACLAYADSVLADVENVEIETFVKVSEVLMSSYEITQIETIQEKTDEIDQVIQEKEAAQEEEEAKAAEENAKKEAEEEARRLEEEKKKEAQEMVGDFELLYGLEQYDSYGSANNGFLIVGKNGLYGAVDYDNNVIVPLQYKYPCSIANDDGLMWFGDDNGYYVFDKNGAIVFETEHTIMSVSEGVILCVNRTDNEYTAEYYNLDGQLLFDKTVFREMNINSIGMSENKAYFYQGGGNFIYNFDIIDSSGVAKNLVYGDDEDEQNKSQKQNDINDANGNVDLNFEKVLDSGFIGMPVGGVNDGYFVSKREWGDGTYEIFVNTAEVDKGFPIGLDELYYNSENGYDSWTVSGFYKNGVTVYNNGTICNLKLYKGEEDTYVLINVDPNNAKKQEFDYLKINEEMYWLISKDGMWGYTDHDGNIVALYEDAADFSNGEALIIEEGIAYKINQNLDKINKGCKADAVTNYGDIWKLTIGEQVYYVK